MELTKEYFDNMIAGLATKRDIAGLATKEDLTALESRIDERFDEFAAMVQRGFADIAERLEVCEQVDELKAQMREVRKELNLV